MSLPPLGFDVSAVAGYDALTYEAYVDPRSGTITGGLCWLDTADSRVRTGIWRLDTNECAAPVAFLGPERFQVLDGYTEVVVNDVVLMTLGPGDVGVVRESVLTDWWISPPFAKLLVVQEDEECGSLGGAR